VSQRGQSITGGGPGVRQDGAITSSITRLRVGEILTRHRNCAFFGSRRNGERPAISRDDALDRIVMGKLTATEWA